jgi:hypothetical protein
MAYQSAPQFRVLHALRIKGVANAVTLADITALDVVEVEAHLGELQRADHALYRETRAVWQLTPQGRERHAADLAADAEPVREVIRPQYPAFLGLNESFKVLCGDWQLREGAPNDHSDEVYDKGVIERLLVIDQDVQPVVGAVGAEVERMAPYAPRLESTAQRVADGDHHLFTGVMVGSYHDVWMELHEDLLLTLGVERGAEGSF